MRYYNKREGVQTVEKKEEKILNDFQKARQRKRLFEDMDNLEDNFFTHNCQLPLYYRRKYDINKFNKDAKNQLTNNLKFTKFDFSLVCLECYLIIIAYFQQVEHTGINMFAVVEERKK